MKDRNNLFHEKWLGLAQPSEGLLFSVPVLADAQIAPDLPPELSAAFEEHLDVSDEPRIRDLPRFMRMFLGYAEPGMLVARDGLPSALSFYASEGGQELRPSFALGRGPFASDDPFAAFETPSSASSNATEPPPSQRYFALIWDLTEASRDIDLDDHEAISGPWRYPPTAKFDRLLRHVGIPIGLLFNGRNLRLVYAPAGESTAHLTFRVEHLRGPDGRPLLAALDLLLHARRAYGASPEHTLEGLLRESRRRQADVTEALAKQVFEAVEILLAGFEAAAARDCTSGRLDWLRPAIEAEGDHLYQGVLSVVLRLVFLLYSEDQSLMPVDKRPYSEHLSLFGLYARLTHDAGAHPESMHHRFGAYGQLLALFRAVFFGVKHGELDLPPRRGRLFDPNAYPFLEGGQPDWTAAVLDPAARAAVRPPSIDDGTIHRVLHRLVVFEGQRLSYRTLDVEQIGSVYESLIGYHVLRVASPAVRIGRHGVWVESEALRAMSAAERARFLKETGGLTPAAIQSLEAALKAAGGDESKVLEALSANAVGRRTDVARHRVSAGRLVLQPGEERRRTGSHYTPRSLTERVVRRTLEPLLACLGPERTAEQILQLKICDPAMGSGAFLVATCRELASEIVAAWTRGGELARVIEQHGDAHLHARRLVAQQCLYGVDKNAAAVELAKLSLWLITLSKQLPFTFVDHALRHGDSLVGLDFRQIEAFHWAPPGQVETCRQLLRDALDEAVALRQQILALAECDDVASQAEKRRLFEFSQQAIERVRIVADVCVGAFFAETKDAAREKERKRRLDLVEKWIRSDRLASDESGTEEQREKDFGASAAARAELEELASDARRTLQPFHWWIEFPEVFFEERPDPLQAGAVNRAALMESIVGNPPFLGGTMISTAHGSGYLSWLGHLIGGNGNRADLCGYFFRQANRLLGEHGTIGLVATNTIAQGDTRERALSPLLAEGVRIVGADTDMPWPGNAAVSVSLVFLAKGVCSDRAQVVLNGSIVGSINSYLQPGRERSRAAPLAAMTGMSFTGAKIYGQGFLLTPDDRRQLALRAPTEAQRVVPYLGGDEVNSSPTQTFERYAINLTDLELSAAAGEFPTLLNVVRERVKPDRDAANDTADGRFLKQYWWRFFRARPELAAALTGLSRCLVTSCVSKHLIFSFQP